MLLCAGGAGVRALFSRALFALLLRAQQPVPRHVAFIMDGNRRFADQRHLDPLGGHASGYRKMVDVITWCLELGAEAVSVYAFSIDNYGRAPDEVAGLMDLAHAKYRELLADGAAARWRVRLLVVGDLLLAPPQVQAAAARLMQSTAERCGGGDDDEGNAAGPGGGRGVVNICFSYTATEELQAAAEAVRAGVAARELDAGDVDGALLGRCLRTAGCPPVDLLVRTSAEERLSDFLLAQSGHALLHFVPCLWPQLSCVSVALAVLRWQRAAPALQRLRGAADARCRAVEQSGQAAATAAAGAVATTAASLASLRRRRGGAAAAPDSPAAAGGGGAHEAPSPSPHACNGDGGGSDAAAADAPALDGRGPRVHAFLRRLERERWEWVRATAAAAAADGG